MANDDTLQATAQPYWGFQFGTAADDTLQATTANAQLFGGEGIDHLQGGSGDTVFLGGAGADRLAAGQGADLFRFESLTDSYRTATTSHADVISNFDLAHDRLDIAALDLVGFGPLKLIYNEAKDRTYLKSFDPDAEGRRFELVLEGDQRNVLGMNIQGKVQGNDQPNQVHLDYPQAYTYDMAGGRDTVVAGATDDRLIGGTGGDTLSGGAGADVFEYQSLNDSLRSDAPGGTAGRDQLLDFNASEGDLLDLRALGFSGLGNGHGATLKAIASSDGSYTLLKSYETNAAGAHFEIRLEGNQASALDGAIVFHDASPAEATPGPELTLLGQADA